MKKRALIPLLIISLFFPARALAAQLILEPLDGGVGVRVLVNTEGENLNAFSGRILFPNSLKVAELRDGNSIVNFWIEKPSEGAGAVEFAGFTPNGFNGTRGPLFEVLFHTDQKGSAEIYAQDVQFLHNDGIGSPAETASGILNLAWGAQVWPAAALRDTVPPEEFTPVVSQSTYIFGGKYFLAFATQDKTSGIASYSVAESLSRWGSLDWKPATSPYLLSDQSRGSYIFVKAVDMAGNERLEMISPEHSGGGWSIWLWAIIIVGVLAAVLSRVKLKRGNV